MHRAGRSAYPLVRLPPGGGVFRDVVLRMSGCSEAGVLPDCYPTAPKMPPNIPNFSPKSGTVTNSLALASRRFVVSPYLSSEGDGTRTRNHRIDSPVL